MYFELSIADMSYTDFIIEIINRRDLIHDIDDLDYLKIFIFIVSTHSLSSWAKQLSLIDNNILLLAPTFHLVYHLILILSPQTLHP